ncbi:uncharacterized protein LOC116339449 [Contarinia nasturtii]|uniref:uncharacterized protein LOC116339449 n=1 Tax=Contarinia nasturtii TaxID=265458 RepID=UPI0012D42016|nr:uncharacterized protein LOC116339449 [Contarinia nasturtii]
MASGGGKKQANRNSTSNSTAPAPNSTAQEKPEKPEYVPQFMQEISDIMRGYGDCEKPLMQTVILVEKIVIEQMRSLLIDIINVAMDRKGKPQPTQKDFEFMMRKHPTKLFRLQKHLKDLDFKRRYQDMISGRPMTYAEDFDEENFEEPEEVAEKYDEEKVRRLFRADRISLTLDAKKYAEFNEARRTSFHCRNSAAIKAKLKTIINPPAGATISGHVYTILGYLVHETIATLCDYAILTRLDSSNRAVDPFHRIATSGTSFSMMHLCPEVTQGRAEDGIKPITVQEIQEAMRRHTMNYERPLGLHRNIIDRYSSMPYLAI